MDTVSLVAVLAGILVLLLGLPSKWLEQRPIPLSLIALLFGIAVGPAGLRLLDITDHGERTAIVEAFARLALGIGLVAIALRVPRAHPRREWRVLAVVIGAGMPLMWAASTLVLLILLPIPFWMAALLGAIVTPTDPIAAAPIVTGPLAERNLQPELRHVIAFESGANDGLGYLFVFLAFLMLTRSPEAALQEWVVHTLLWEVLAATLIGVGIGAGAAYLLRQAEDHDLIEEEWRLVYTVALTLLAVGGGRLIGSDELLVAFAAGATFVQMSRESDREEEERGQEAVNRFFAFPLFVLIGMTIPWAAWLELGWRGPAVALGILIFRRLPAFLLLRPWLGDFRPLPRTLFLGWFAPIAGAAAYYSHLIEHQLGEPLLWTVTSLVICTSMVAHGLSATPLTKLYGRRCGSQLELAVADRPVNPQLADV